jgi:hypothetical protein
MIGSVIPSLLELAQANGVKPHQSDERKSERDEREIEHDRLLAPSYVGGRKVSISIGRTSHKDFIKPSTTFTMTH